MTKVVRKELSQDSNGELLFEVLEDNPVSHRVVITLSKDGAPLGRANLGTVFRKQNPQQADALVDALLGSMDVVAMPITAEGATELPTTNVPIPVKARGPNGETGHGVELDHLTRRDFGDTLRALADMIETGDKRLTIHQLDIEPKRGGGQNVSLRLTRKS